MREIRHGDRNAKLPRPRRELPLRPGELLIDGRVMFSSAWLDGRVERVDTRGRLVAFTPRQS